MATLREYYETEFNHAVRHNIRFSGLEGVEGAILYDFGGGVLYLSLYVSEDNWQVPDFLRLAEAVKPGSQLITDSHVQLPRARTFQGADLTIQNKDGVPSFSVKYFGEDEWIRADELVGSGRVCIYTGADLSTSDKALIKNKALAFGLRIQFKTKSYAAMVSALEKPLAFISHDSRDNEVARAIAIGLQRLRCPVWYDEFSLKVGDHLRDSIEAGLKSCKKCVLILSENFLGNTGWTKREFDSIFTRELLESKNLVLPVWHSVTKQQVFEYSPGLANVFALNWVKGEDHVVRNLYNAITQ